MSVRCARYHHNEGPIIHPTNDRAEQAYCWRHERTGYLVRSRGRVDKSGAFVASSLFFCEDSALGVKKSFHRPMQRSLHRDIAETPKDRKNNFDKPSEFLQKYRH
jgi:hypothetical protein